MTVAAARVRLGFLLGVEGAQALLLVYSWCQHRRPSQPSPCRLPCTQPADCQDGLAFASVGPTSALELVRWLQRYPQEGLHIYFDTFPRKEDPVRPACPLGGLS